jgi:hypothetical protein
MTNDEINKRFDHHPPDKVKAARHEHMRAAYKRLAELVDEELDDTREKSLAMTELETSLMWANAAIARNP